MSVCINREAGIRVCQVIWHWNRIWIRHTIGLSSLFSRQLRLDWGFWGLGLGQLWIVLPPHLFRYLLIGTLDSCLRQGGFDTRLSVISVSIYFMSVGFVVLDYRCYIFEGDWGLKGGAWILGYFTFICLSIYFLQITVSYSLRLMKVQLEFGSKFCVNMNWLWVR